MYKYGVRPMGVGHFDYVKVFDTREEAWAYLLLGNKNTSLKEIDEKEEWGWHITRFVPKNNS